MGSLKIQPFQKNTKIVERKKNRRDKKEKSRPKVKKEVIKDYKPTVAGLLAEVRSSQ